MRSIKKIPLAKDVRNWYNRDTTAVSFESHVEKSRYRQDVLFLLFCRPALVVLVLRHELGLKVSELRPVTSCAAVLGMVVKTYSLMLLSIGSNTLEPRSVVKGFSMASHLDNFPILTYFSRQISSLPLLGVLTTRIPTPPLAYSWYS